VIYIGTCGFSYKDWIGGFYPATIRQGEMLEYYAACFPAVEIDASYYGMLSATSIARMLARTPPQFRFCFKVPRSVTHPPDFKAVHADAAEFARSVQPVIDAKKFGCALLQFPNGFHCNDASRSYLQRAAAALDPIPLVAEFRNREWQTFETHELLAQMGVGWCNVDMPSYETLLHPSSDVTGVAGYVRFHGRNAAQWWTGDNTTRYAYDYTAGELEPWTERVAEISERIGATYAFFNNHARGNAARNAQLFTEMLRERYGPLAQQVIPAGRRPPSQQSLFE
jgi:uncharacterized protein YecE (DUF72 family)